MNFFMRFVVVAAGLALTGCFNSDHIDVANMAPTGSAFQAALQKGYSDLAKHEYDEGDWHDGYGYVKKARSAAAGEDVEPELVWDWDVPEEFVDELHNARDGIGFWARRNASLACWRKHRLCTTAGSKSRKRTINRAI